MDKVIMHVDMDAFFAAVEIADNKNLKGKPVIIGGNSERGVVATCSYEARVMGVKSAMPTYIANRICPNAIFLPVRYERYKEVSNKIFNVLYEVTSSIEPVSIDEAYLDITEVDKNPLDVANYIKNRVMEETELTISVGISYNKFLAKLASDWNKPNGLKIIRPEEIPKILFQLPINKVHGLGQKSVQRLQKTVGVYTVEELYKLPQDLLIAFFGKSGMEIYERIRGIDKRIVQTTRERKSIGRESTLRRDTDDKDELRSYLRVFAEDVAGTMGMKGLKGRTITIKIKTESFVSHTKSKSLTYYVFSEEDIYKEACCILDELEFEEKIRLIGLSVSSFKEDGLEQLSFL